VILCIHREFVQQPWRAYLNSCVLRAAGVTFESRMLCGGWSFRPCNQLSNRGLPSVEQERCTVCSYDNSVAVGWLFEAWGRVSFGVFKGSAPNSPRCC